MIVRFNNLAEQYLTLKKQIDKKLQFCLTKDNLILGKSVATFEANFANFIGVKHTVGVSNGTDAIKLALRAFDIQNSLIIYIQANTYISTIFSAIDAYPFAKIELIDVDETNQIDLKLLEAKLTNNIKKFNNHIIIPVHMFGWMCNMKALIKIAKKYNAYVLEDASQSHGAEGMDGRKTGSYGDIGAFSLYPTKNLGAFGDAGIITTNNKILFKKILMLRNIGQQKKFIHSIKGYNCRMDSIQAAVLTEKLKYLNKWNTERNKIAQYYLEHITNPLLKLPVIPPFCKKPCWHAFFVITEKRDRLISYLKKQNIEFNFHYLIPAEQSIPLQELNQYSINARAFCEHHVSIPIHPFMKKEEVKYVCNKLNKFL